MGLGQLIKQISPRGVCDHLLEPRWGLPETKGRATDLTLVSEVGAALAIIPTGRDHGVSGEAGLAMVTQLAEWKASWVLVHSF